MDAQNIPEVINDYNVYRNGNKYIGVSGQVSLAEWTAITQAIEGTGVLGHYNAPVTGMFDHMDQAIPFRDIDEDELLTMNVGTQQELTLRMAEQYVRRKDGASDYRGIRITFAGRVTAMAPGSVQQGVSMNSSVTLGIQRVQIWIANREKLALDKLNGIYRVDGVDMLDKIKSFT